MIFPQKGHLIQIDNISYKEDLKRFYAYYLKSLNRKSTTRNEYEILQ